MGVHHLAVAVKDVQKAHEFYTEAMGFELVKVVKRQTPEGGWTKHIFYDIGDGTLFAIWDLKGIEGVVVEADEWRGGMSVGCGLPYWINHVAFQARDRADLDAKKQRWLDYGKNVVEVVRRINSAQIPSMNANSEAACWSESILQTVSISTTTSFG